PGRAAPRQAPPPYLQVTRAKPQIVAAGNRPPQPAESTRNERFQLVLMRDDHVAARTQPAHLAKNDHAELVYMNSECKSTNTCRRSTSRADREAQFGIRVERKGVPRR